MKLLALSGSLRKASTNTGLLRALAEIAPKPISIEIATLHGIPIYDGDDEAASGKPEAIQILNAKVRAADGIIISIPEYNFSFPGGLKNATDWLSRGGSPFRWKRVGILGAADGPLGTARAQYQFRQNLVGLEAITMPKPEIFVGSASSKFDASGNLTDADTRQRLGKWLEAFAEWVHTKP
jgi:chromate reductase, NAD(P)H dehydrogenase (quinone)